jgi:hypothetical protein
MPRAGHAFDLGWLPPQAEAVPIHQRTWTTKNLDEHVGLIARQVNRSLRDGETRRLGVKIVSGTFDRGRDRNGNEVQVVSAYGRTFLAPPGPVCKSRNEECEIEKIWDFVVLNIRYVYDPADIDTFPTLKETLMMGGEDCFPEGTLLLRDDHTLVPVEQLKPGMKIWGRARWSEITNQWCKGVRPVTAIRMNNGSWMHLTEDHKVYVAQCEHERRGNATCGGTRCRMDVREIIRVPVAELKPGMVLLAPDQIESAPGVADEKFLALAELTGLYLSDGWSEDHRIGIAGKDGHPKEAQKYRVQELAKILGFNTGSRERYIYVYGNEIAQHCAQFGRGAPNKRLPNLHYTKTAAELLLSGIMADSDRRDNTFTTTSRTLAVQTRVLHRMMGTSCGWAYIENHGGLGTHPIWRLHKRHAGGERREKLLTVKEIVRNIQEATVYDISTDDHYVYLPEHDVTVSNCDGLTVAFAALLKTIGFTVSGRVISVRENPDQPVHIYPMVGLPKDDPRRWVPLDATVEGAVPGWQYPGIAQHKDYLL